MKKGVESSDRYEGEYENDKKCGVGVFTWADGSCYSGEYFDDLRHGRGRMSMPDGTVKEVRERMR